MTKLIAVVGTQEQLQQFIEDMGQYRYEQLIKQGYELVIDFGRPPVAQIRLDDEAPLYTGVRIVSKELIMYAEITILHLFLKKPPYANNSRSSHTQ